MDIALTIAGSDSGGGAGIQADLKTFQAFGVYGTSVIVAVTAQNTVGVRAAEGVSQTLVRAQLEALADDLPPAALKTGMLFSTELVGTVAEAIERHRWQPYVLDPVMIATSGDRLLSPGAESAVRRKLLPLATLVTPNLHEASLLTGLSVTTPTEMETAGLALLEAGAEAALITGGHLAGSELVDVLVTQNGTISYRHTRIETLATHGTGCTLSAAITACLARGASLTEAVAGAGEYPRRAIATAPRLGRGHGPVDHSVAATIPSTSEPRRPPT